MILALAGLAAFALLALALLATHRASRQRPGDETWQDFARQSGGTYAENPVGRSRTVTLTERGWPLTLEAWSTLDGPGDSIQSYAKFLAHGAFAPVAPYELHAESRLPRAPSLSLTRRGGDAFQTGDADLDSAYTFHASDPGRAAVLLRNQAVRGLLLELNRGEAYLDVAADGQRWAVRFGDEDAPVSLARLADARRLIAAVLDGLEADGAARKPAARGPSAPASWPGAGGKAE